MNPETIKTPNGKQKKKKNEIWKIAIEESTADNWIFSN